MDDGGRLLSEAGTLLFGPGWHRAMARALGPLHPAAARNAVDDRLIRRWAAGARPVPAQALEAAATLVAAEHARAASTCTDSAELAPQLRAAVGSVLHSGRIR